MSGDQEHPRLLFWYVTSDLEKEQAQQVERHIRWCPACRIEAQDLSTALNTLRADPTAQISPAAPHAQSPTEPSSRWRDPGAGAPQLAGRDGWPAPLAMLVAAAAGFALAFGPAWLLLRQRGPEPSVREVKTLALSPPQRGHTTGRIVAGEGPYALILVLPFDAPEGTYRLRIEREDGSLPRLEANASTHGDGTLTLLLEPPPPAGHYVVLAREPDEGGAGPSHVYPFEVAAGEATPFP